MTSLATPDRLPTRPVYRRAVLIVMHDRTGHPEAREAQMASTGRVAASTTLHTWQERDPFTGRRTGK